MDAPLGQRFEAALVDAARLHRDQVRKTSQVPYVSHLLAVCALVLEDGGDEDEAIAALLHDAVEDQGGAATLAHIRDRFGDRVADIVDGCSDTDQTPKPPWRLRKEAYLAHLADPATSPSVLSLHATTMAATRAPKRDRISASATPWSSTASCSRAATASSSSPPSSMTSDATANRWAT